MPVRDDDWAVLGVAPGSPLAVTRAAYLHRARLLHPDRHPDATPGERARLDAAMAALNTAWDRIEAGMAAPAPPRDDPSEPEPSPGARSSTARSAASGGPSFPEGFLVSRADPTGVRWSLRLWTDDLEPLRLLSTHRAGAVVSGLDLHCRPIRDRDLLVLANLPVLERLDLSDTEVTDAGLGRVADLPRLRHLALAGTAITDRGLVTVTGCGSLRFLTLCDTEVTDEGVAALALLPLVTLNLRGTQVEGQALDALATCPSLQLLAVPRLDRIARRRFALARPDVVLA